MNVLLYVRLASFFCFAGLFVHGSRFDPKTVKPLGNPPGRLLNATEFIEYYGYNGSRYEAVTSDGYILGVTRIGRNNGPPVLMINGMGLPPELWVLHGPGHDLAFVLHDLGYDVWLGGQRGLTGSLGHTKYQPSDPEYWDFSHDESGVYDLPAMIDLILSESGHTQLYYFGTSLGGTLLMVMCSQRPEYCSSIAGNVQFVPAMWIPQWEQLHFTSKLVLNVLKSFVSVLVEAGQHGMVVLPELYVSLMLNICGSEIGQIPCFQLLHLVTGFNHQNMAKGWLGYTLALSAAGTSIRQVEHLLQLTRKGGTEMYDWGQEKNLMHYGATDPPSYNISRITSPTVVYYSESDVLIVKPAMMKTVNLLGKNIKYARTMPDHTYGHAEFVFGKDLYKYCYSDIVDFFDSLSGLNIKV